MIDAKKSSCADCGIREWKCDNKMVDIVHTMRIASNKCKGKYVLNILIELHFNCIG